MKKYDFAGWVTKNDILCSDGVVIRHDAFKGGNTRVPLVWNHDHSTPENVIGHIDLEHRDQGVYGYGYFNSGGRAKDAKEMVKHGDISSMSIGANKIRKEANNVVHGVIREVSLVLAGANPGAMIETVMMHSSEECLEEGTIWTGTLIHSYDDLPDYYQEDEDLDPEEREDLKELDEDEPINHKEEESMGKELTVGEVIDGMTEEQRQAMEIVIGTAIEEAKDDMKHNAFDGNGELQHSNQGPTYEEIVESAMQDNTTLKHAAGDYGIENIEILFPEAKTVGENIHTFKDQNTNTEKILASIHKSPFAHIKSVFASFTEKEARAKGYVKGNEKFEQVFPVAMRKTLPGTIYKKQKLDRDDIVDITDYNIVSYIQSEMRMMLNEEIVRAVLVGDGREIDDPDKINETNIRPIINDDKLYVTRLEVENPSDVLEAVIYALADYNGSGTPSLYVNPTTASALKLVKDATGRYIFGEIPTLDKIAALLGVKEIVVTSFLAKEDMLIVNLADYTLGATAGGKTTTFDDFDIDFNQYKYLIETRLSGALTVPKSAIHVKIKNVQLMTPSVKVVIDGEETNPPSDD